jgi:hypothetical protein
MPYTYASSNYFDGQSDDYSDQSVARSVARADVAELTAALTPAVAGEPDHHLVVVSTKKTLSTTQFKQMFYSRGDDHFQIANVYECSDSGQSVLNSVWGVVSDFADAGHAGSHLGHHPDGTNQGAAGASGDTAGSAGGSTAYEQTGADYLTSATDGMGSWDDLGADKRVYNFNKLGGRTNDPKGTQWAYSYVQDNSRNMYAQFEVMGNLEKDTCVKRDQWTLCSRMSIEDQLYGLAFASETDQDLCMKVSCARRWSEVEDALAESCLAAGHQIRNTEKVDLYINVRVTNGNPATLDTIFRIRFTVKFREHYPSVRGLWNTSATKAASGVLQDGVVFDGPEGGKRQVEGSTVVDPHTDYVG